MFFFDAAFEDERFFDLVLWRCSDLWLLLLPPAMLDLLLDFLFSNASWLLTAPLMLTRLPMERRPLLEE